MVAGNGALTFLLGLSTARVGDIRRGAIIVWAGVLFLVLVRRVPGENLFGGLRPMRRVT